MQDPKSLPNTQPTIKFYKKKWFTFLGFPCILGIIAAVITLLINPNIGEDFGNRIYNSNVNIISYSYGIARSSPSVVNIYVSELNRDYSGMSNEANKITTSASGVIISEDGFIITNYHVIPSLNEPNKTVWAQTSNGKIHQAFIVGFDRRTDLAVLKIAGNKHPVIPINPQYEPKVGDLVFAIGNPNNLGQTVTHGIISSTARTGSGLLTREFMNIREGLQDLIQTDAPINSGNSGGALVNSSGDLVGINTASFNDYRSGTYGIGFAVPTKLVMRVTKEIILHGRVVRGYLGISDEGADNSPILNLQGVKIGYVDPMGPAYGVMFEGDIITQVNDIKVTNVRTLIDIISNNSPGTTLNFNVKRDGKNLVLPITLAEDKYNID